LAQTEKNAKVYTNKILSTLLHLTNNAEKLGKVIVTLYVISAFNYPLIVTPIALKGFVFEIITCGNTTAHQDWKLRCWVPPLN